MRNTSTRIALVLAASSVLHVCAQTNASPGFVVPDARDVTIKTRRTIDRPNSTVETESVFLKRAWQRRERVLQFPSTVAAGGTRTHVWITRCDDRQTLLLDATSRTFASSTIEDGARYRVWTATRTPPAVATGPNVTITIDAVDTGGRRQAGPFVARHVITTTRTEAEPGASAHTSLSVQDGWYIDLPPADCRDAGENESILLGSVVRAGSEPDRVRVARRGTARRGFPIEEATHADDRSPATSVAPIEISETPLDDALFTVPAGYRAALPRLRGGFDMTKPDTLVNRLVSYWDDATAWTRSILGY